MSAGDVLGRVELAGRGRATVYSHPEGARTVHIDAGAVSIMLDLDADQAAELVRLLMPERPDETPSVAVQGLVEGQRAVLLVDADDARVLRGLVDDRLYGDARDPHEDGPVLEALRDNLLDLGDELGPGSLP